MSHQRSNQTQIIIEIDANTHRKNKSIFNINSQYNDEIEEMEESTFT